MAPRISKEMLAALKLIIHKGKSAAEASRITGIGKSAISQNAQYRAFISAKGESKK